MKKLLLLLMLVFIGQYAAQAQEYTHKKVVKHTYHRRVVRKHSPVYRHRTVTTRSKHNIKVVQDAPHNPYEGKPSRQNDGVKKNEQRNMNYQTGQPLPPSNGSNMK